MTPEKHCRNVPRTLSFIPYVTEGDRPLGHGQTRGLLLGRLCAVWVVVVCRDALEGRGEENVIR